MGYTYTRVIYFFPEIQVEQGVLYCLFAESGSPVWRGCLAASGDRLEVAAEGVLLASSGRGLLLDSPQRSGRPLVTQNELPMRHVCPPRGGQLACAGGPPGPCNARGRGFLLGGLRVCSRSHRRPSDNCLQCSRKRKVQSLRWSVQASQAHSSGKVMAVVRNSTPCGFFSWIFVF